MSCDEKNEPMQILSLGAGVQSSTLALMAAHGEIGPMPDCAIFADTQAEPASVYKWLDWLTEQLPYPVHIVSKGSLTTVVTQYRTNKDGKQSARNILPLFVDTGVGPAGAVMRGCTMDHKISPLLKKERELANVKRGEKSVKCISWIGISVDEVVRMKDSRVAWCKHRWPLIEKGMNRHDCKQWMNRNGYPEPPRSACVYCPFHSNNEWRRLKEDDPDGFAEAVRVERMIQKLHGTARDGMPGRIKGVPFLHRSMVNIGEVDFSTETDHGQLDMFQNECEGMCGV